MKKLLALVLAIVMIASLTACAASGAKKVVLGTSADYAPFEFHTMLDGKDTIVGIDVSVAKAIAADMGAELEIADMNFENLLTLMAQGNCDFVIAAMEIDDDRVKNATPSDPYYTDLPAMIVVKAANLDQYNSMEDFNGKVVGAQTGTTKASIVTDEMTGAVPSLMTNVVDLLSNLSYDKCDAVVLDGAVALQAVKSNPELAVVEAVPLGEALPYCVWVQKDDPKGLLPSINKTIASLVEQNKLDEFVAEADKLSEE